MMHHDKEDRRTGGQGSVASCIIFAAGILLAAACAFAAPVTAGGTITPLTLNLTGVTSLNPAISGHLVAWQDDTGGTSGITLYNITSGEQRRVPGTPASARSAPSIDGETVAFVDDGGGSDNNIFLYHAGTNETEQVTDDPADQGAPAVSGPWVVWQDQRSGTWTIYLNGTGPGTEQPLSPASGNQEYPSIHGDLVAWQDDRNAPAVPHDIYVHNLTTGTTTRLTDHASDKIRPAISGDGVAWMDNRNGGIYSVYASNGTSPGQEYRIAPEVIFEDERDPALFGTTAVWVRGDGIICRDDIVAPSRACDPVHSNAYARITGPGVSDDPGYGERIVWQEEEVSFNIFLFTEGGPGVCPAAGFTSDYAGGSAPVTVQFTGPASPGISSWYWDFGDGSFSMERDPAHEYVDDGSYTVTLAVGSPFCRNATTIPGAVQIGKPVADFSASERIGLIPLTVRFSDLSSGTPTAWLWDFGDGMPPSTEQNPVHEYTAGGNYTVLLTVSNAYGTGTLVRENFISVLKATTTTAVTDIPGIAVSSSGPDQGITVDAALVPAALIPNGSVLELAPPAASGFGNITVFALDGYGFLQSGALITGNVTGVRFHTADLCPEGFPALIGKNVSVNYTVASRYYPVGATLTTEVIHGTLPDDWDKLLRIVSENRAFIGRKGIPYTVRITGTGFPAGTPATLRMSVNASWVESVNQGADVILFQRISSDRLSGEVLPTVLLGHDPVTGLNYYEADSPRGFSTFALSSISGWNNIFQVVSFAVTEIVNNQDNFQSQSSESSDIGGGIIAGTEQPALQQEQPPAQAAPRAARETHFADLYINTNGVVTQETVLRSSDSLASLTIGRGILALGADKTPLSSVSMAAVPAGELPSFTGAGEVSFTGRAYDLQPDGATFSPAIPLRFHATAAPYGEGFFVKMHDPATGTWQDLISAFDPEEGTVTAQVPHFCTVALFTGASLGQTSRAPEPTPGLPSPPRVTPAPGTAMGNLLAMAFAVAGVLGEYPILVGGIIILIVAIVLSYRKRRRDQILYPR